MWKILDYSLPKGMTVVRLGMQLGLLVWVTAACAVPRLPIPKTPSPSAPPTATQVAVPGPIVDDTGIVSLHMHDAENGWAVSETHVLRTADGGLSWHDVSPETTGALGYTVTVDFLDNLRGWVLQPDANDMRRGTLYRTNDGGRTWTDSPVPFGGGSLQFLDAKQGWMMAALGAGAGSMAVAVYQTTDGGATWTRTYINDPTQGGAGDSLPLGGLKNGLCATSMQVAWIGGVTYAPGTIYLYLTRDAGRTWQKVSLEAPAGYEQAELQTTGPAFLDSRTGYLPVHVTSQSGILLAVYVTHDAGTTWMPSPAFVPQGGAADFVSDTTAFVWNGSSFYVSNDSAQNWAVVTPDIAFSASFAGMDFVTPEIGYVLSDDGSGNRRLYGTLDGGKTWDAIGK